MVLQAISDDRSRPWRGWGGMQAAQCVARPRVADPRVPRPRVAVKWAPIKASFT